MCVHGTSFVAVASVLSTEAGQDGLKPGGLAGSRKHVHCAQHPLLDARLKAGMRKSSTEGEIFVDMYCLLEAGFDGYMSSAGVLLFPAEIPVEFIKRA